MEHRRISYNPVETQEQQIVARLYSNVTHFKTYTTFVFDMLNAIIQRRAWEKLSIHKGKIVTFRDIIELPFHEGGIGWSVDELLVFVNLKQNYENVSSDVRGKSEYVRTEVVRLLEITK